MTEQPTQVEDTPLTPLPILTEERANLFFDDVKRLVHNDYPELAHSPITVIGVVNDAVCNWWIPAAGVDARVDTVAVLRVLHGLYQAIEHYNQKLVKQLAAYDDIAGKLAKEINERQATLREIGKTPEPDPVVDLGPDTN